MKALFEISGELCATVAAILWFVSARTRLRERRVIRRGLAGDMDDPKALLLMVYEQSRWSAWAAIAAGLAALCALADGLVPGT